MFLGLRKQGIRSAPISPQAWAEGTLSCPPPPRDSNCSPTRIWGAPRCLTLSSLQASRPLHGPCLCQEPPRWCSLSLCLALDVSDAFYSFLHFLHSRGVPFLPSSAPSPSP